MSETEKYKLALSTFKTICAMLDEGDWHYDVNEKKLSITFVLKGDYFNLDIKIVVDPDRSRVTLFIFAPFTVPNDKRIDVALAVNMINSLLINGCFDFNIKDGSILFRMTNSFRDSELSKDVFAYMLYCSCMTAGKYDDKLFMISKGAFNLEQLREFLDE